MHVSTLRRTQAERRARSRSALLESAARGLSRYGYGNLVLERVASDAGYTRGALYHQFADKEDLALAVLEWVDETWREEVGRQVDEESDPFRALITLARGHAVFCRRDIARVAIAVSTPLRSSTDAIADAAMRAGMPEPSLADTTEAPCLMASSMSVLAGSIPPMTSMTMSASVMIDSASVVNRAGSMMARPHLAS